MGQFSADMEKIIRIGGVDVKERSCSVAFNAGIYHEGSLMTIQNLEFTHNTLYKLLETATEVKAYIPKENEDTTKFCTLKQGEIEFHIYTKKERK